MKEKIINFFFITSSAIMIFLIMYFVIGIMFRSVAVINNDTEQKSLQRIANTLERIELRLNQEEIIKNER